MWMVTGSTPVAKLVALTTPARSVVVTASFTAVIALATAVQPL